MEILFAILALVVVVVLGVWLYIVHQGDCDIQFLTEQCTEFSYLGATVNSVMLQCKVPFINRTQQDGTLIDVFSRALLPQEEYNKVHIDTYLYDDEHPRTDGYWEATIIPLNTGGTITVHVTITAKEGSIDQLLREMPEFRVRIFYETVGRSDMRIERTTLYLTRQELQQAAEVMGRQTA